MSYLPCDFSSFADIRQLAAEFRARHDRLDVLVNNAGGVSKTRRLSKDGIELTFAVNHLGYFLLTTLLTDLLVKSAPARVVSVASVGHRSGTLDFDDLGYEQGYGIMRAYSRSKLANVLFSNELARRLAGTGVTSNKHAPGRGEHAGSGRARRGMRSRSSRCCARSRSSARKRAAATLSISPPIPSSRGHREIFRGRRDERPRAARARRGAGAALVGRQRVDGRLT